MNAEGYCKKCRNPLGIDGVCYVCEVDSESFRKVLNSVFICSICGQHKTHYRLYGYRCSNPEHAEMERRQRLNEDR
jgi:hypothetical protein